MVHGLQEAWCVLVSRGPLIDLRPICLDIPLEIITASGSESAGLVDMSPEIDKDIASDAAIQTVVSEGLYIKEIQEYFDSAYYWNTIREFEADLDERWKDDIILPRDVLKQGRALYKKHPEGARVRMRIRMTLTKFTKA